MRLLLRRPLLRRLLIVATCLATLALAPSARADDEHLTALYRSLNDSPMQRKLRALKPFPVGVVYWQDRGADLAAIRKTFATIRETGFDSLKQIVLLGGEDVKATEKERTAFLEQVMNAALEEGVYPWYYGLGGWAPITDELLQKLQIPSDTPLPELQAHPKIRAYQDKILRQRIANAKNLPPLPANVKMGEPGRQPPFFPERKAAPFAAWLRKQYDSVERLRDAWNVTSTSGLEIATFDQAARLLIGATDSRPNRDLRRYRDSMRFQADTAAADYDAVIAHRIKFDPWEPVRTGGHHLLDNQAASGWDLEAQAHAAAPGGSFYASIHLAHHLREVGHEIDRPVYLQARLIADNFKGGWAAVWESTGGPTMWSGHGSLTVDGGVMTRLMLSYIGAGLRGIGLWMWNPRDLGTEGGEYALTDLLGRPSERARAAGAIARALQRHRFELWDAEGEPLAGILGSWENEATYARLSLGHPPQNRASAFQKIPSQARMGWARALLDANLPFEIVTERDLAAGLAGRYRVIVLPAHLTLTPAALEHLLAFARAGGRVVADMPMGLYDDHGRLLDSRPGSAFARLFGVSLVDFRNTHNAPERLLGPAGPVTLAGQYAELEALPGGASVAARFANGLPARTEHAVGAGRVVILNGELSRAAHEPGHAAEQAILVAATLGEAGRAKGTGASGAGARNGVATPRWRAEGRGVLVYRRSAPAADHYFFVNDGDARAVTVSVTDRDYRAAEDGVTGEKLATSARALRVPVPARSGRWVRVSRR